MSHAVYTHFTRPVTVIYAFAEETAIVASRFLYHQSCLASVPTVDFERPAKGCVDPTILVGHVVQEVDNAKPSEFLHRRRPKSDIMQLGVVKPSGLRYGVRECMMTPGKYQVRLKPWAFINLFSLGRYREWERG